jgi:hypothetical protein
VLLDFKSEPPYVSAAELIHADFILANRDKYELIGEEDCVMLFKTTDNM